MAGGKRNMGGAGCQRRSATTNSTTLEDQCHPRKIFIGGLAGDTSKHDLRTYFGRFGSIIDSVVLQWPDGSSRGFGYVTFSDSRSASASLVGSHSLGGQDVEVKRAVPGTNKLFVGGLPQNTMAAELREHFEAFGVVSDAVVMIDPASGRSRGFGFICFTPGQEGAAAVAAALDQYKSHRIRGKWIEVKNAAPQKFASREQSGEPAPGCSAGAAPPLCQAPLPLMVQPAMREMTQQVGNSNNNALPNLLGAANSANPKKVLLPSSLAAAIGAPPGLGDSFEAPRKETADRHLGEIEATNHRGFIPWPCVGSAAAPGMPGLGAPPPLFSGSSGSSLAPGLLAPPPGKFARSDPCSMSAFLSQQHEPGSVTSVDLTAALQQNLEKLVRLKMCGSSMQVPSNGFAMPEQATLA